MWLELPVCPMCGGESQIMEPLEAD
jgi:hypothetical protein